MRATFLAALLATGMPAGGTALAEEWSFGGGAFQVQAPTGFRLEGGTSPAVYHGPSGEAALVSTHLATLVLPRDEADGKVAVLMEMAKATFMKAEVRYGDGIGEISVEPLAGGGRNLSWVIDTSHKARAEYVVMLAAISSNADLAIITIEGRGNPIEALERFRPMLNTVRWGRAR